ncbi:prepilin-type N-terminal cleavage/methylation domain-containing protein [Ornithinibacillus halotolerans]|uniref:Prepilin-type N-terminal cleavage/methylation domain-containing protein n=1 Tax=Ornithinibacillus halotolerans TaxID=1274357 RepID=A0A916S593_9BACI|nr:prepilin-type N-terminal cleavage/methylation domain-containing protein [Ornithinibacillus halotolerans]GGA82106.1 hypothetical protein GCM10008025_26670 [Ornithinibacillus halotolerans]
MMKKWLRLLKKDERGLTLVELLAVIVILAIVGAIAFVSISNVIDNSKKDAQIANAQQLISAAKLYEANGGEITASGVSAIETGTGDAAVEADLDVGTLTDPWGNNVYTTATVFKSDTGEYSVALVSSGGQCDLSADTATETALIQQGRELCEAEGTTGG